MTLTFSETHNMIAYLTKSDASEGFNQIIDFLNGSSIKYALTVNPNIYVLCIKQFWTSVSVKKVNEVTRLHKKKVVITEASIRDALHLDDAKGAVSDDVNAAVDEPSIPSPTPPTPPPQPSQDIPFTSQEEESEPTELQEVVDVVTTAKIITEVVTAASDTITAASNTITVADVPIPTATTAAAPTLTTAPSRRRNGVVIRDSQETTTTTTMIHSEAKSKDKGKGILVEEPKPLKKQAQIEQDEKYARELEVELNKNIDWDETETQARKNMMIYLKNVAGFKMDYFKRMNYDDIRPIFEKYFDSNMDFLQKTKEQIDEEDSRALKRLNESQEEKAAKKQKLDEEVEELKKHLQIVPNDEDDVYTEATPFACKIITFTKTQLILLVERRYPLTRFTLDQMLNNVRLKVEEESEVSLELLSFGVDAAMDFKENMLSV
nr:hypothetical protein [Tanacetum cinerariifolium]